MALFTQSWGLWSTMNRENWPLVTDEPVEFEKQPIEVQDFRKFTKHLKESTEYTLKFVRSTKRKMSTTCNRIDYWQHQDLDWKFCPKFISPHTDAPPLSQPHEFASNASQTFDAIQLGTLLCCATHKAVLVQLITFSCIWQRGPAAGK